MSAVEHLANHQIERHLAQLLSDQERHEIDAHLGSCAACRDRLEQARGRAEAYLAQNPPEIRARQAQAIAAEGTARSPWPRLLIWAGAPALVLLAAVLLWPGRPVVQSKGGATEVAFSVFRPATGKTWEGRSGETLQPGDRLQLSLRRVEGADRASLWTMSEAGAPARVVDMTLPRRAMSFSMELDEAPGPERVWLIYSVGALDDAVVRAVLRAACPRADQCLEVMEAPALPLLLVSSVLIRKE